MTLGLPQVNTQAATKNPLKTMPKAEKIIVGSDDDRYCYFYTPGYKKKVTLKATSSNKKVATVKTKTYKVKSDKMYYAIYEVKCKKFGKTKIKVTAKVNGKTYRKTCTYLFEKYQNPFSSFTINGQDYTSLLNKGDCIEAKDQYLSGVVSYTLKPQYKIKKFYATIDNEKNLDIYTVKNHKNLKSYTTDLSITIQNKKTKATCTIILSGADSDD